MNESDINQIAALVNEGNLHLKRMIISIDKPYISESIKETIENDNNEFEFNFQKYVVENNKIVMIPSHSVTEFVSESKPNKKVELNNEVDKNSENIETSQLKSNKNEEKTVSQRPEKKINEVKKSPGRPRKTKSMEVPIEKSNLNRQKPSKRLVDISQLTNINNEQEYEKKREELVSPSSVLLKQLENENFNAPKLKSERGEDEYEEDPVLPNKYVIHAVKDQCTVLIPENVK